MSTSIRIPALHRTARKCEDVKTPQNPTDDTEDYCESQPSLPYSAHDHYGCSLFYLCCNEKSQVE